MTGRRVARKNDQVRSLGTDRVGPVVTEDAPADGTGVAAIHGNYLEISGPRIPGVFLELAEEVIISHQPWALWANRLDWDWETTWKV